jgi:hypothetical protein
MRVMLHRTPNGRNAGPRHHVTLSHVPEQLSDRMMLRARSAGLEIGSWWFVFRQVAR